MKPCQKLIEPVQLSFLSVKSRFWPNALKRVFLVLEVSRNDAQYGEVVDELDRTVPNRNPDGETSLQAKWIRTSLLKLLLQSSALEIFFRNYYNTRSN